VLSVVHVSTTDNAGGSGRAAYRIHSAIRRSGHRSRMLVSLRVTDDADVAPVWGTLPWRAADWLAGRVTERLSLQYLCYPSSVRLLGHPWVREADVVQLYNTHGGYFSHTILPLLSRRRPVVWRLSDMWPMTGHCAYAFECERWKTGCGACPLLADAPALRVDRTALLWRVKRWAYARSALTLVAPSRWIAGLAAASPLLSRFPVHWIPNGVDTDVFRPIPKGAARAVLGLDPGERVVLFSALETADRRKGGAVLAEALGRSGAGPRLPYRLLVVGRGAERWTGPGPAAVTAMPTVGDDRLLAAVYSAADVFVSPALAENLPNAALESLACGTPVVAFDVGGVADAVRPLETGYLAASGDPADLARGIDRLLADEALRLRLGRRGREVAEQEYGQDLQTRRFLALYEEILERVPASGRAARPTGGAVPR
jgi:glycosyltransferase involved in cell wall biosynthesis